MLLKRRLSLLFVYLFLAISTQVVSAQKASPETTYLRFDPTWWQNTYSNEQQGFIVGYLDCRRIPHGAKASYVAYQDAVAAHLKKATADDGDAVTTAIEYAAKHLPSNALDPSAEHYPRPHGFLDGSWWGEFQTDWPLDAQQEDKGYLEGYLACASPPVSAQRVRRYQAAINRHYASGAHERDSVADVLHRLMTPTPQKNP